MTGLVGQIAILSRWASDVYLIRNLAPHRSYKCCMFIRTNSASEITRKKTFQKRLCQVVKLSDSRTVWTKRPDHPCANRLVWSSAEMSVFRFCPKCLYYGPFGPSDRTIRQYWPVRVPIWYNPWVVVRTVRTKVTDHVPNYFEQGLYVFAELAGRLFVPRSWTVLTLKLRAVRLCSVDLPPVLKSGGQSSGYSSSQVANIRLGSADHPCLTFLIALKCFLKRK